MQSEGDAWREVEIQIFARSPTEDGLLVPAVAEPLLVWIIAGSAFVEERELNGEWHGRKVSKCDFFLTHATAPYMMRWKSDNGASFEVLHLYLGLSLLSRMIAEVAGQKSGVRLRDVSGAQDDVISSLLTVLHKEMQASSAASSIFVQGIAQSLTIHLVRSYGETSDEPARKLDQLPRYKLRRAVDFMEENLAEEFNLEKVAQAAGMSRFHFSRGFRSSMSQSPSQWFIRQRITRAQELLRETDLPIIEIAMTVGYESPSHFAQVFRRETGVSPNQYRTG
ncbi:AraC family transcriptional regulator [Acidisoma silvae]|nr:AraC family transcriptional regulator [Acidisoma silvae]